MKMISQKEFFRRRINGSYAKYGSPIYLGSIEVSDKLTEDIFSKTDEKVFRLVNHTPSYVLMFENQSWLLYTMPKDCDSRDAYIHSINCVDHCPAYCNQFDPSRARRTMFFSYEIQP